MGNKNKVVRIPIEDLMYDEVAIINLDAKTDTIGLIRGLKEVTIFPIVNEKKDD